MNSFVIDVDMATIPMFMDEQMVKEMKGAECECCFRSNVPLYLYGEDTVCENCLESIQYTDYCNEVEN